MLTGGKEVSEAGSHGVWRVLMSVVGNNGAGKGWGRCHGWAGDEALSDGIRKGLPGKSIVQKPSFIQEKTMLALQVFPLKLVKQIQRDDGETVFVS